MGFQEARSDISICNRALSLIRQQTLTGSLTDPANMNKQAAKECVLWYKPTVRLLLEKHHWGIATERVALLPITSDRAEWPFAYAVPTDMAFPVSLSAYSTTATASVNYYQGLGYIIASLYGRPMFRYESGNMYALSATGMLDYVSFNITENDFNQTFEDLVVISLAAALARSIAKNDKLADSMEAKAQHAINLAIAQNLNQQGPRYGSFISESEMVRSGGLLVDDNYGLNC